MRLKERLEELAAERAQQKEVEQLERLAALQEAAKEYLRETSGGHKESNLESGEQEQVNSELAEDSQQNPYEPLLPKADDPPDVAKNKIKLLHGLLRLHRADKECQ